MEAQRFDINTHYRGKPGKGGKEVAIIPDDVPEETVCGCEAVSLASRAICQAAASVNDVPLYEHIARLRHKEVTAQNNAVLSNTYAVLSNTYTDVYPLRFSVY